MLFELNLIANRPIWVCRKPYLMVPLGSTWMTAER